MLCPGLDHDRYAVFSGSLSLIVGVLRGLLFAIRLAIRRILLAAAQSLLCFYLGNLNVSESILLAICSRKGLTIGLTRNSMQTRYNKALNFSRSHSQFGPSNLSNLWVKPLRQMLWLRLFTRLISCTTPTPSTPSPLKQQASRHRQSSRRRYPAVLPTGSKGRSSGIEESRPHRACSVSQHGKYHAAHPNISICLLGCQASHVRQ